MSEWLEKDCPVSKYNVDVNGMMPLHMATECSTLITPEKRVCLITKLTQVLPSAKLPPFLLLVLLGK